MEAVPQELSPDSVTVDGLDALFVEPVQGVMTVNGDKDLAGDVTVDSADLWTLQDAAQSLGISTRTVLRKLKSGALKGRKVIGTNGPEWRITPPDIQPMTVMHSVKTVTSDSQSTDAPTRDTPIEALLRVIETQAKQIDAASEQVKAANPSHHVSAVSARRERNSNQTIDRHAA